MAKMKKEITISEDNILKITITQDGLAVFTKNLDISKSVKCLLEYGVSQKFSDFVARPKNEKLSLEEMKTEFERLAQMLESGELKTKKAGKAKYKILTLEGAKEFFKTQGVETSELMITMMVSTGVFSPAVLQEYIEEQKAKRK